MNVRGTTPKREMLLYRNLEHQTLFENLCRLLDTAVGAECTQEENELPDCWGCANQLIELAVTYGFRGNLWHCFLAFCMANHENAYSTSCEITGPAGGTLSQLAAYDFALFRELFACDIAVLDGDGGGIWTLMKTYENPSMSCRAFNHKIRDRIIELAETLAKTKTTEEFQETVTEFYREFGVGRFGLHKAFHLCMEETEHRVKIEPITRMEHILLEDLVGYELQKKKLIENTEAFLEGRACNNVLLYGDSGTGKSSSIKAILNQYYDQGLRMIEVYKHQFRGLSDVLEQIRDRKYKFIIYMDDLSFEEYETEYKYLKAMIEGGLGIKPQNVLIYATSNRRHLVREKFSDKKELLDDDLHANDTVQEKLSLVARFGVTIYYGSPNKKEFQTIVRVLAEKYAVAMPEEELYLEANKWELSHGGLSGRTAAQFIAYLLGKAGWEER